MDENKPKNVVDKFFDVAESIVGGMEKGSKLVYVEGEEKEEVEDAEIVSESTQLLRHSPKVIKPALLWGAIGTDHHVFEGFSLSSMCGREFENSQFKYRKTEMDMDGIVNACGTCLRILHNRYKNQ
jgi:hypothetical protein